MPPGSVDGASDANPPYNFNNAPNFSSFGESYHAVARLKSNKPALLIDPGSVHNLCGDRWAKEVATHAKRNGKEPGYERR
jgi:hypothetical protein